MILDRPNKKLTIELDNSSVNIQVFKKCGVKFEQATTENVSCIIPFFLITTYTLLPHCILERKNEWTSGFRGGVE